MFFSFFFTNRLRHSHSTVISPFLKRFYVFICLRSPLVTRGDFQWGHIHVFCFLEEFWPLMQLPLACAWVSSIGLPYGSPAWVCRISLNCIFFTGSINDHLWTFTSNVGTISPWTICFIEFFLTQPSFALLAPKLPWPGEATDSDLLEKGSHKASPI